MDKKGLHMSLSPLFAKKLARETLEQMALFDWIALKPKISPYAFHIPNEGKRSRMGGGILKRMGLRKGASDVFIAIPKNEYHGLFIELKADKASNITDSQVQFIKDMRSQGYYAVVCYGSQDAMSVINDYLVDYTLEESIKNRFL